MPNTHPRQVDMTFMIDHEMSAFEFGVITMEMVELHGGEALAAAQARARPIYRQVLAMQRARAWKMTIIGCFYGVTPIVAGVIALLRRVPGDKSLLLILAFCGVSYSLRKLSDWFLRIMDRKDRIVIEL